jgi:hypothetical protein
MSAIHRFFSTLCEVTIFLGVSGLVIPPSGLGRNSLPEQQEDDSLSHGGGQGGDLCDSLLDLLGKAQGQDIKSVLNSLGAPDFLDLGELRDKFKNCLSAGSSSGIAKGDFNGDGFAYLAVGVPNKETPAGVPRSGAVIVIYGSANGLTTTDSSKPAPQFWSQNTDGVSGVSESADTFGSALAAGDFNQDGFSDLAIGVPGEDIESAGDPDTGRVVVIFGSPNGLTTTDTTRPASQTFDLRNLLGDVNLESEAFGSALAWGDFNGDGKSDLAVGIPGEDIGNSVNSGRVVIIYGSSKGLVTSGPDLVLAPQSFDLGSALDVIDDEAGLGSALAWGDFNGDGIGDLAVGAPGLQRSNGFPATLTVQHNAGGVWVLYGQPNNGLTLANNQLWAQEDSSDSIGTLGSSNEDDNFGASLAAGNFNGDSSSGKPISDLAIGVPQESDFGFLRSISHAGRVIVLYGVSGTGLAKRSAQSWSQDSDGIVSEPVAGEKFGFSLAAGDFNGDKKDDLAVGVPGQSLTETVIIASGTPNVTVSTRNAGAVHIIPGSSSGLTANGSQFWNQDLVFGSGHGESDDAFGRALAAGDFNADGKADLAIGVPREDVGSVDKAGEVNVIYGSSAGLSTTVRTPQIFRDSTPEAGAEFGRSLTAWNFGRDETHILPPDNFSVTVKTADLAIGVPFKDVNGQEDAGAVTVFYGSSDANGLTTSSRQTWTEDSPNVPGSAEPGANFGLTLY